MGFRAWLESFFCQAVRIPTHELGSISDYKIIKTTARHIKAIHALDKQCFSDPWSIKSLKYEITHPRSVCLVAISSNVILGHIIMEQVLDEGHIFNIAVAEQARRQGIGRRLLDEVISKAKSLGIKTLTLEVRSQNQAAISLYENLGFKTCGRRKNYYHKPADDALVMKKENL